MTRRIRRCLARGAWFALAHLVGVVYLVGATGVVPNPALVVRWAGIASGERYPCEGGACGCASAHECWTTCQCHTLEQKVAWADREGLPIPPYVDLSGVRRGSIAPTPARCPVCVKHARIVPENEEMCGGPVEQADARPPAMPCFSPMPCKGISALMAFATPMVARTPLIEVAGATEPRVEPWGACGARAPETRVIDTPSPPPRPRAA